MRAQTAFETHARTIAQKCRDGLDFTRIGSPDDAESLRRELASLAFDGCTIREIAKLMRMQSQACARIDAAMREPETAQ